MKIDFSQNLYNLDGKVIQDIKIVDEIGKDGNSKPRKFEKDVTLRAVVSAVLQTAMPGDDKLSVEKRTHLFNLLLRINKECIIDFPIEEIALLKARVAMASYNNIIVGQTLVLLEGAENNLVNLSDGVEDNNSEGDNDDEE